MTEQSDSLFASGLPGTLTEAQLKEGFGAYGTVKWCKLVPKPQEGTMCAIVQFGSVDEAAFLVENLSGSSLHEHMPEPVTMEFHKNKPPAGGGGFGGCGFGCGGDEGGDMGMGGGKGFGGFGKGFGKGFGEKGGPYGWPGSFGFGAWGGGKGAWGPMMGMAMGEATIAVLKEGLTRGGILPGSKWTDDDPALYISGLPSDTNDSDLYEIFAPFGAIPPKGIRAMRSKEDDSKCSGVGFVNYILAEDAQKAIMTLNGTMLPDGSLLRVQMKGNRKKQGIKPQQGS